jgi:hypothetical protein
MVVSPWNHIKVALVVGGNTDVAVVKAAQAVSSTVIRTGNRLDAALVEDVNALDTLSGFLATDRTLADLGYGVEILDGSGLSRFDLEFNVPPGQTVVAEEEAALNLIFNHSSLLDYTRSGLVLRVNNEPVGSVRLSDVSTSLVSQQIVIPRTAIHAGVNQLTLLAELSPLAECDTLGRDSLWLNIQPESSLHLPLGPAQDAVVGAVTLDGYPEPFTFDQTLSTTAFVLPANDPVAWDVAAKLAFDLGKYVNGVVLDVIVAYGHDVPEAVRQGRDLLIVGRPTTLPILAEINDRLPAPFTPGSDRVVDERLAVAYRIAPEIGLGYVEFLPAPWDSNRTVIAVLGTAEGGLRAAATALLTPEQRRKFAGDFVVVQGSQVFTPAVLTAAGAAEGSEAAVDGQGDQVVSEGTREAMATPVATAVVSHTAAADEARTASNMANSRPTPTAEVSFNLGGLTVDRPVAEAEPANNNGPVETVERVNPLNLALWASVGIGVLLLLFLGVGIARQR